MFKHLFVITSIELLLVIALAVPAHADRTIDVNFSTGELTVTDTTQTTALLFTPVVLPKGNYYPVPVTGTVRRAEMGPVWIPTDRMHRDKPGKYKDRYGPYEPGNAMGNCKLSIDFNSKESILQYVRIHGGAKEKDLRRRVSRSCIRIPNDMCQSLVDLSSNYEGKVLVSFHR